MDPCQATTVGRLPALRLQGPGENQCTVLLQGAQVWSCQFAGRERLYASPLSPLQPGIPARGGIPLCWPWLGRHPQHPEAGMHGHLRSLPFELDATGGNHRHHWLRLSCLMPSGLPAVLNDCRMSITVALSHQGMFVAWDIKNLGNRPQPSAGAMHSYLACRSEQAAVHGLGGLPWQGPDECPIWGCSEEPIRELIGRTRTVYQSQPGPVDFEDGHGSRMRLQRHGSLSLVLWNPGQNHGIADLPTEAWQDFCCLESANSGQDARLIPPGGRHCMISRFTFPMSEPLPS